MTSQDRKFKFRYMTGTEYGGGRKKTILHSCPQGFTKDDLKYLFGDEKSYRVFKAHMTGEVMGYCYKCEVPHGIVTIPIDVARYISYNPIPIQEP